MRILFISLFIIIIDQASKLIVRGFSIPFLEIQHTGMHHGERIQIIGDFFRFTFIENPGMAFGIDPGPNFKLWISVFSFIASIGLLIYLYVVRNESLSLKAALAFILGGAIGNLIDRMFYGIIFDYAPLFYGKVVDFLDFDFFDFTIFGRGYDRWPIFNIADASVTTGVFILILFYRKHSKKADELDLAEKPASSENINLVNLDEIKNNSADTIVNKDLGSEEKLKSDKNKLQNDEPDKGKDFSL